MKVLGGETILEGGGGFLIYNINKEFTEFRIRPVFNLRFFFRARKIHKGETFGEDLYEYSIRNGNVGIVTYEQLPEVILFSWFRLCKQIGLSVEITLLDALACGQVIELLKMLKVTDSGDIKPPMWKRISVETGTRRNLPSGTTFHYFVIHGFEESKVRRRINFSSARKINIINGDFFKYQFLSYVLIDIVIEERALDIFGGVFRDLIEARFN